MFKRKERTKELIKKQIALILAIVMAFSSLASTGMALSKAYAAPTTENNYGVNFVNKLVEITANRTPYVWGGWQYNYPNGSSGVDCRGFVRVALRDTYGLNIFETYGYLVNEQGDPINKKGEVVAYEKRVKIDMAAYGAADTWDDYVGMRVCVEGNGIHTYYRVLAAGQCGSLKTYNNQYKNNVLDIKFNKNTYSSLIAYACKFPGSIIAHNGHYGVGVGEYHSMEELLADYPELDQKATGTACTESDRMIRWSESAYNYGNQYPEDDLKYWFGKTVFISACSTKSGIRLDNFTTTGKSSNPTKNDDLTILLCESQVPQSEVTFTKYDTKTGDTLAGAVYKVYKNSACTIEVTEFTTTETSVPVQLDYGTYYVKEFSAPKGYELSTDVVTVDARSEKVSVSLYDQATDATVFVRKVDAIDGISLDGAKLALYEWNKDKNGYESEPMVILQYNKLTGAYTIDGVYTNNEGDEQTDNALHYTQTNTGKFLLKEEEAPTGYINSNFTYEYDMTKDGALMLTNDTAIKNTANLVVRVTKTDLDGNPLSGAHLKLVYNDLTYEGYTDEFGTWIISNIPEGPTRVAKLIEVTPPEGYKALGAYATEEGQTVMLNKGIDPLTLEVGEGENKQTYVGFFSEITVVNVREEVELPPITEGTIHIQKLDLSYVQEVIPGVYFPSRPLDGATYGVFTDPECLQLAVDSSGKELKGVSADGGKITFTNVPLGTYYIKELWAPEGHTIVSTVYPANLLLDYVNNGTVETTVKVFDFRQTVTVSMVKVDAETGKGIEGSVYALKNKTEIVDPVFGTAIEPHTTLGYYVTNKNGQIMATRMGSQQIEIREEMFPSVVFFGEWSEHVALPNGEYYFEEQSAPSGYVVDSTPVEINATWQSNSFSQDMVLENGTVSAHGMIYSAKAQAHKEKRQNVVIEFSKIDGLLNNNNTSLWYPDLENYAAAANNGLAATLQGAKYQLINDTEIIDIETGVNIPANTVLGIYETDAAGKFTADVFTQGIFKDHKIPNGTYYLVEMQAPQGYALNADPVIIDAEWSPLYSDQQTITIQKTAKDFVLTQNVQINKVTSDGKPIQGVKFELYSVADILETCQMENLESIWHNNILNANGFAPINREALKNLIEQYNLEPAVDAVGNTLFETDENGIALTDQFVYGDYILYEVATVDGYAISTTATYMQLPWELFDNEGSDDDHGDHGDLNNGHVSANRYYSHDVESTPTSPLDVTVVNMLNTTVLISKYETVNGTKTPVADATLQLIDVNTNDVVVLQDGTVCEWVTTAESNTTGLYGLPAYEIRGIQPGTYQVKEIATPSGYVSAVFEPFTVVLTDSKQEFAFENQYTSIAIDKLDAESGTPLVGAEMAIVDQYDNIARDAFGTELKWTTNGSTQVFTHVPVGNYFVKELHAPHGYQLNTEKVAIDVTDTATTVHASMQDARTYGKILIDKIDDETNNPLVGVVFEIRSKSEVVDPITGAVIYSEGQVLDTVITDDNGDATSTILPIATYDRNGLAQFIEYLVVETQPVPGSQYAPAAIRTVVLPYLGETTPIVESEMVAITNSKPIVTVKKSANIKTFVGDVAQYKDVTVLQNGDLITYTITVQNAGTASAWHVAVKDTVPANTTLVDYDADTCTYDEQTQTLSWIIKEVTNNQPVQLSFTVQVNNDKACSIVNTAFYSIPDEIPTNVDSLPSINDYDEWDKTNDVVYQTVEFNKTSTVQGGYNDATAVTVTPGEVITYHLTFKAVHDVSSVMFIDEIPAGMTYVAGSAKINGVATNNIALNGNTLTFAPINIDNETIIATFDVTVDYVPPGDPRYFVNIAEAAYNSTPDANEPTVITSDVVTHMADNNITVVKTASPVSYQSTSADAWATDNNAKLTVLRQGENIVYTLTAINNGQSAVKNVVITDVIPTGLQYVSHTQPEGIESWYDAETQRITWCIANIDKQTEIPVSFTATVKEQKAQIISNTAHYGVVREVVGVPTLDNPNVTNTITHQVIEFHKNSEVIGGKDQAQATVVAVGDTIDYVLSIENPHTVYNVSVFDKIPDGLKYVPGSICIKYGDEDWTAIDDSDIMNANQGKEATAIHLAFDKLQAGTYYLKFSVTVKDIPLNTEKFFMNSATLTYNQFADNNDSEQQLESEEVHHMTDVKIVGNKTGVLETFVGDYDERINVAVVHDNDEIAYVITVTNNGASTLHDVKIKDVLPEHTTFVSADNNGTYVADSGEVHWVVDEIKAGETVNVTVTVKCDTNGNAYDLINRAYYTVADNEWIATDEVVYQTVKFTKTSDVLGGTNESNATAVSVGDTITYLMIFEAPSDVYDVTVSDKIPDGLTYVPGSATINGAPAAVTVNNENVLVFETKDINNAQYVFAFDVTVDPVELNTPTTYINRATAIYSNRGSDGSIETLISDEVTHKTEVKCEVSKTATPSTYVGDKNTAQSVTVLKQNDIVTYTISVKNTGISRLHNIAIKDTIPDGLTYIPNDLWGNTLAWYDENTKQLTLFIDTIGVGESVDLTFECVVEKQEAQLIVNTAYYELVEQNGNEPPVFTDNIKKTNDVVHQVVEFHKTSTVLGGDKKESATAVNTGDIIEYVLLFETKHDVSSLEIFDQLPEGLEYVPGSIAIKSNDSEWETIDDSVILAENEGKNATAIHVAFDHTVNGKLYLKFAASVKRIPVNTEKFFMNQATAKYDVFTNTNDSIKNELLSEEVHHMTDVKITGNKDAKLDTFVGKYDDKHHVTIVQDGDELEYIITISNNGVSTLQNVVVFDQIPEHTTFVSTNADGAYDAEENCVVWKIQEIQPGESVSVTLIVKCDTNGEATEIVNQAFYAVVGNDETDDDTWFETESVVYQTVAIEKSASIKYGIDETDAEHVAIGTEFTYEIKFTSTNDVYNLTLSDKLPVGLTLLPETLKCLLPNGEYATIEEFTITQDNVIILPTIDFVESGDTTLTFNVKVADVEEYDKDYIYINQAFASVSTNETSEQLIELESNTVSNKTMKTNKTETPALGLEVNEALMWSIVAVISAVGTFGFGIYAFIDKKSKRK